MIRQLLIAATLFTLLSSATLALAQDPNALAYPRVVKENGLELRIHHPVIDSWTDYEVLEGWIPVEVIRTASGEQWVGALRARAQSEVRLEDRTVLLSGQEVIDTRFSDRDTPAEVIAFARESLKNNTHQITMAEVLLALAEDFKPPFERPDPGFNRRPPRVVVSESPVSLLLIDQEPVKAPIKGTNLEVVVNTDWILFYDKQGRDWYVINDGVWQTESLLASGNWTSVDELPQDFVNLAVGERWREIRDALPPKIPAVAPNPLLISLEPTELIEIDGEPVLQSIPGAGGLAVVANSTSDLFRLENDWYFLASGRWFTSENLTEEWEPVQDLPEEFSRIPEDHGRASVRQSVPGTIESAIAYIAATMPQSKNVGADSQPEQQVVYLGEPRFEPIPQTQVSRAVNTPFAVIQHNNSYYLNYEAAWYRSSTPTGPWQVALVVPEEIFSIPPSDPLHYVTYVKPAGNQPANGEARFTYSEGYNGMYTIGSNAVRGTGWSYTPWVGYYGGGPVYWGYPYTYGFRGRYYHHPYAYWGAYTPMQQISIDGASRHVGGSGAPTIAEQDPRLTRPGYDYTTLAGQRLEESRAAGYVADDLFADPQGQVYRKADDGWSRHDDGEWSTMADLERQYGVGGGAPVTQPENQQRQAYKQNQDDIDRMERYYDRRSKSYNSYMNVYVPR